MKKKIMVLIVPILLSLILISTPVVAAGTITMGLSFTPSFKDEPMMLDPATDLFSRWYASYGDEGVWKVYGDNLIATVWLKGEWDYPEEVTVSVEFPTTLADGYEALPIKYITVEPTVQLLDEYERATFYIKVALPDKNKYYGRHYQVNTIFCAHAEYSGICIRGIFYLITPEKNHKKGGIRQDANPDYSQGTARDG